MSDREGGQQNEQQGISNIEKKEKKRKEIFGVFQMSITEKNFKYSLFHSEIEIFLIFK